MRDNGLLRQFNSAINSDGILDLDCVIPNKFRWKDLEALSLGHGEFKGLYYAKYCGSKKAEVEVLLSQIYADFFRSTAIYLPTIVKPVKYGAISNDILKDDAVLMYDYIRDKNLPNPYALDNNLTSEELLLRSYFVEKALKEYVDMHLLDVGCGNIDRHARNFGVESRSVDGGQLVTGLRLFDFGNARFYLSEFEANSFLSNGWLFRNGLGGSTEVSRLELINSFKENEIVQSFYTNTEIAEMVGNINVHEKVVDIKDNIGFQVSKDLENSLSGALNNMAEQMIK